MATFDFTEIKSKGKIGSLGSYPQYSDTDIITIPIDMIDDYDADNDNNHPFKPYSAEQLQELAKSIAINGLLQPIILIRKYDGRYKILAGHNRCAACKMINMDHIKSIIMPQDMPIEEQQLIMVDTNLAQRNKLSTKERAKAYKIKYESLKAIGKKGIYTKMASEIGESPKSVKRYIALNNLCDVLLDYVDKDKIKIVVGVILSNISLTSQNAIVDYIDNNEGELRIDEKQAYQIKDIADVRELTIDDVEKILTKKPKKKPQEIKIPYGDIAEIMCYQPVDVAESCIRWLIANNKDVIADYLIGKKENIES